MFKISTHICNAIKNHTLIVKNIELNERKEIIDGILIKYINVNQEGFWLWEKLICYEVLNDDMAWSYIKDFVNSNECIMFFNQDEDKEMFSIESGGDLDYILSETYGFEFYITDRQCSYLLCFSHHNILYGCGTAEKWVHNLRNAIV